jgi:hypothetical protein
MFGPKKPATGSPQYLSQHTVRILETRSFQTYKSRINAYHRLSRRNNAWNAALIAFSTATTIASIGLLVNDRMYGRGGDALMVALAVLSLVASLVASSVNYGARARAMEASYKRIQQISLGAESFDCSAPTSARDLEKLQKEYEVALESSENHSDADFLRTAEGEPPKKVRRQLLRDSFVSLVPYLSLVAPALLLVPFVSWFFNGFD